MEIRKNMLPRGPAYCWIAGFVSYRLLILLYQQFAIVTDAENTASLDPVRALIAGGLVFALAVAGGRLVFQRMTRKEVFCSVSIVVVFELLLVLIQQCVPITESALLVFTIYFDFFMGWCGDFILELLFRLGLDTFSASLLFCFTPYLFLLFGKKGQADFQP